MDKYEENGINNYIKNCDSKGSFFLYENSRSLLAVYNDSVLEPVMLVLDERYESSDAIEAPDEYEKRLTEISLDIAKKLGVPLLIIKYPDSYDTFDDNSQIWTWTSEKKPETAFAENNYVDADGLIGIMKRLAQKKVYVRVFNNSKKPFKDKNSSLSGAFHQWTRDNIGIGAFVDIDLVRVDGNIVKEIVELKRSQYVGFDKWRPYTNDINNLAILADIAQRLKVPLDLVFNRQSETDLPDVEEMYKFKTKKNSEDIYDIIDKVKVFSIRAADEGFNIPIGIPTLLGECSLEEFISAEYTDDIFLKGRIAAKWNDRVIKRLRALFGYLCSRFGIDPQYDEILHKGKSAFDTIKSALKEDDTDMMNTGLGKAQTDLELICGILLDLGEDSPENEVSFDPVIEDIRCLSAIIDRIILLNGISEE